MSLKSIYLSSCKIVNKCGAVAKKACVWLRRDGCREGQPHSCFCGLGFPFSSLSLCSKNSLFILSLSLFFRLVANGRRYETLGIAGYFPIQLHRTWSGAERLHNHLTPNVLWPLVSNWPLFSFVILSSNIRNIYNRSAAVSWCVGAGWAGRLFCKPLVGALARVGLQMCLPAKGWAGWLERMLFVFVFRVSI